MRYALADRKSAAAQNRMRNIADLANEGKSNEPKGQKRGRKKQGVQQDEDTFGAKDSDWKIYKDIVSCLPYYILANNYRKMKMIAKTKKKKLRIWTRWRPSFSRMILNSRWKIPARPVAKHSANF